MLESALTTDKKVLSHVRKGNLQLWIDGFSELDGLLKSYVWNIGLSDLDGALIYDWKRVKLGELKHANDQGAVIYSGLDFDPRGGAVTVVATKGATPSDVSSGNLPQGPGLMMHSCRHGAITNGHLIFNINPIRSSQTSTVTDPTNKVTVGGKAGTDIGVWKAEGNASYEHGFRSGSTADTRGGALTDITVIWVPK